MTLLALRSLFGRVPIWVWFVIAALAWGGYQRHRATVAVQELADVRESAYRTALIETTRRLTVQTEITNAASIALAQARADAADAAVAAGRLRDAARAAGRRACPAVAGASPAASAPAVVLAELYDWADGRAGDLAAAVDAARIAGTACEQSYEALIQRTGDK